MACLETTSDARPAPALTQARGPSPRPGRGVLSSIVAKEQVPEWIGGCRLLEMLGAGGMGAVYLCEHPNGGRYAVKLLAARAPGNRRARFLRLPGLLRRPRFIFLPGFRRRARFLLLLPGVLTTHTPVAIGPQFQ